MNRAQIDGKRKEFLAAFAVVAMFAVVTPAFAMKTDPGPTTGQPLLDQAIGGRCVPAAAKDLLRSYTLKIASAPTVEEAREMILSQTNLARKALSTAAWIMPASPSVREAAEKVGNLESRVYAANTQREIARDFSDFLAVPTDRGDPKIVAQDAADSSPMILAEVDLDRSAIRVGDGDGHGCNYTNGEVVIIVLGFLLLIIPGIIFLVIFC